MNFGIGVDLWGIIKDVVKKIPTAYKESASEGIWGKPKISITERLDGLKNDVYKFKPEFVAEKIGIILRDELLHTKNINIDQYNNLTSNIIIACSDQFSHLRVFWNGTKIYSKEPEEIFIICEPPLEIIEGEINTLRILRQQTNLPTVKSVNYYLSNRLYINKLIEKIENINLMNEAKSKIIINEIDSKIDNPVVLIKNKYGNWSGIKGRHRPIVAEDEYGNLTLKSKINKFWIEDITSEEIYTNRNKIDSFQIKTVTNLGKR